MLMDDLGQLLEKLQRTLREVLHEVKRVTDLVRHTRYDVTQCRKLLVGDQSSLHPC